MHGIHIANDIISKARQQGKVKNAKIIVGEIANITISDLDKQMKNFADFPYEFQEEKAIVKCECGYEGSPKVIERQHDVVLFECPECGKTPEVLQGDKVILKSVEVE
ncbi:hydrogenase maturation nickel metallochaperone HypA [Candidatus Woesearchaeota archaeon]|nr:hydrogenase maturation nickel metallochaperone HypA [Candidatus Woesearchaeota archaeon]